MAAAQPPEIEEAREAVSRVVNGVNRAAEIINHLRSLYKKGAPTERELVDVNEVAWEMLTLLRSEANPALDFNAHRTGRRSSQNQG